ncbi:MAG: hypothetical protein WBB85_08655, partial [Albidovulum sp.]|uniref:PepSY domain-containing protein n=1 Tax=Albidovulum sp. TaxID=1872424 RepID=UPI003C93B36B
MFRNLLSIGLVVFGLAPSLAWAAEPRELNQNELRQSVDAGRSLGLQKILSSIKRRVSGEPVDVRAFETDGIYYHVLVMQPNGVLASVIVDAATGRMVSGKSANAKAVRQAARANPSGKGVGNPGKGKGKSNGKSGDKGGAGGNSGGNGGGNGGGSGGGNGGGNGGGSGGGNG